MAFWKKKEEENVQTVKTIGGWSQSGNIQTSSGSNQAGDGDRNKASALLASALAKNESSSSGMNRDNLDDYLDKRFGKLRSALGSGTVIQGKLSFDAPVRIDGQLSGEVYSSKPLIIGPRGQVSADLDVAELIILGKVKGKVKVRERVEVLGQGILEADVTTPVFVVEHGAIFDGKISMPAIGAKESVPAAIENAGKSAPSNGKA